MLTLSLKFAVRLCLGDVPHALQEDHLFQLAFAPTSLEGSHLFDAVWVVPLN